MKIIKKTYDKNIHLDGFMPPRLAIKLTLVLWQTPRTKLDVVNCYAHHPRRKIINNKAVIESDRLRVDGSALISKSGNSD